jgi:ribonuclease HI
LPPFLAFVPIRRNHPKSRVIGHNLILTLPKRNISERLEGDLQTNQRAELTAILRALQVVPLEQHVMIRTDSQYSINCVTVWAPGWEKKQWKTAQGEDVKNRDLVEAIRAHLKLREQRQTQTVFKWLKGHSTDEGNNAADQLAVSGARAGKAAKAKR